MYKLLRIAALALPLGGGVALAQGSGTNGSAGAPDIVPPMGSTGTNDTRTPMQKRAGALDDGTSPAVPGDATRPRSLPETAPMSDRPGLPDDTSDRAAPDTQKSTDEKGATVPKSDLHDETPSDK
jgi:hypothetical protein